MHTVPTALAQDTFTHTATGITFWYDIQNFVEPACSPR
jgi:hypothetical protein